MKRTGIPASITLAQGMIESDEGRSSLAREANNHFGIKCHNDWTGGKVYHNDDRRNECFRKYLRSEDSFYDHSDFLKSTPRYSFLFNMSASDYKGWAHGLKKAGYATNPDYDNMLIRTIEEKKLHYYDTDYTPGTAQQKRDITTFQAVAAAGTDKNPPPAASVNVNNRVPTAPVAVDNRVQPSPVNESNPVVARVSRIMENNNLKYIIVRDGDTRQKIEDEYQLLSWELARYNDLANDFSLSPGQILYLQPKKDKAESGKEYYTSVEGDTMYLISQRYGIKLKSLYKLNRMEADDEPAPGSIIWLRNIKPVN